MSGAARHHRGSGTVVAVAVLTVSDTRTEENDRSGAAARSRIEGAGHGVADYRILPDEPDAVRDQILEWLTRDDCDAVVITGGTGISKRDRTYEAVSELLDKRLDGFGELFRMLSWEQVGSAAMLSRATAGVASNKPIFSLPGSTPAVELGLDRLVLPELGHLLAELRKD